MTDTPHTTLAEIAKHFDTLQDPRSPINRVYPLSSVIVIAIMAILAGANGPAAIAKWALAKEELLRQNLFLPDGVPRKDVFRIVLTLLNPKVFQACFTDWLAALRLDAMARLEIERPLYGVDGKTLRRSHDRAKHVGALHSVSVWASELGLSLGQVACAEKSNEITAIPEVLQLLVLEGAILTIDAMGTQKAIAKQIVDGKGDYVLALKGNQGTLHDAVIDYVASQLENDFAGVDARQLFVTEKLHGQTETRIYTALPFLGASRSKQIAEARHQFVDLAEGIRHRVAGPVQVQHQSAPETVGTFQTIRPLEDHACLVIDPFHRTTALPRLEVVQDLVLPTPERLNKRRQLGERVQQVQEQLEQGA
jgi:hypothetical protein